MADLLVNVPDYYLQTDSKTRHGDRMCYSSTVAMAIKFLKPEALSGSNADDDYLKRVLSFGDTIYTSAQRAAIQTYGLKSYFTRKGTLADLRRILGEGRPVPVPWLHHGHRDAPRGGGHWGLLTGLTDTRGRFHDPYGELDNVNGGYPRPGIGGRNVWYTLKNWLPRWQHGGEAWYLDVYAPITTPDKPKVPSGPKYNADWASVAAIATYYGAKWPQVVAAQWALESGWGKTVSGTHNFFGIKGTPGTVKPTKEFLNGQWVTVNATFKNFASPNACIEEVIRLWYKDYRTFKGVNKAESNAECCVLLKKEGYATDPKYPDLLAKLVFTQ